MTQIYPQSYFHLKKEPFFNDYLIANMETGLLSALDQDITPISSFQALSDIQAAKKTIIKQLPIIKKAWKLNPLPTSLQGQDCSSSMQKSPMLRPTIF